MNQRSLRSPSLAALSLALAAGGFIAIACGSDENEATEGSVPPFAAGGGSENAGGAGTSVTPQPNPDPSSPSPVATGTGGGEGQPAAIPIVDPPTQPGASAGGAGGAGNANEPTEPAPVTPPPLAAPNCNAPEGGVPGLALQLVADGLNQPLYASGVPGDDSRLMVVEKRGTVRVVLNGELQQTPFIDVSSMVRDEAPERGLLGLAFHPDHANNGLFYLHFSSNASAGLPPAGDTVIAEFQVDPNNRSVGNVASRRILLTVTQPQSNHNGGQIAFGPDGMLHLGLGDGGNQNDVGPGHAAIGNGQSLDTLLGKILRIDPLGRDVNNSYGIPAGNLAALTGAQARPEIWAYGVRNPWRFSFDPCNGDFYLADVGDSAMEEVNFVAANAERAIPAGANFGWRIMEGSGCHDTATCNRAGLIAPVDAYDRGVGISVTGGYVYRGNTIPGLRGNYLYADYFANKFFRFRMQNGQIADRTEITNQMRPAAGAAPEGISSFGTDNAGEIYVTSFDPGAIFRVVQAQ